MLMIGYTGLPGSGKTYHMTKIALDLMRRGTTVFSKHIINGAFSIQNERELLYMNNAHVFFDEWHQDHDAKEWWAMDPVLRHIITQRRKYNITIHWSAQHWGYMDSFIRRATDFCWEHEAFMRDSMTGVSRINLHRAIKRHALDMEKNRARKDQLAKKYFRINKKVYTAYDSFKPILLDNSKLTEADIQVILNPYTRKPMELSPNESRDHHAYLEAKQNSLNSQPDTDDDSEGIKRNNETDKLGPSMEVVDPSSDFGRQAADIG